eukprot:3941395-Rhodomonas_salina.1
MLRNAIEAEIAFKAKGQQRLRSRWAGSTAAQLLSPGSVDSPTSTDLATKRSSPSAPSSGAPSFAARSGSPASSCSSFASSQRQSSATRADECNDDDEELQAKLAKERFSREGLDADGAAAAVAVSATASHARDAAAATASAAQAPLQRARADAFAPSSMMSARCLRVDSELPFFVRKGTTVLPIKPDEESGKGKHAQRMTEHASGTLSWSFLAAAKTTTTPTPMFAASFAGSAAGAGQHASTARSPLSPRVSLAPDPAARFYGYDEADATAAANANAPSRRMMMPSVHAGTLYDEDARARAPADAGGLGGGAVRTSPASISTQSHWHWPGPISTQAQAQGRDAPGRG